MLPLMEIEENIPINGTIVDLGCGEGIIAEYLAQNKLRTVVGVDINAKRLKKSGQKNLRFRFADARKYPLAGINSVVLSDVLHHMNFKDQDIILKNIAKGLKKGGVLLIKEIDANEFLRGGLSRFWDFILYPNEKVYFNDAKALESKLIKLGFRVKLKKTMRLFPGSTTLLICRK